MSKKERKNGFSSVKIDKKLSEKAAFFLQKNLQIKVKKIEVKTIGLV